MIGEKQNFGRRFALIIADQKDTAKRYTERQDRQSPDRNMARYSLVLKDYVFPPNFAHLFRYNEQALVYSGLLAG